MKQDSYAGFWIRVVAGLIDTLVLFIPTILIDVLVVKTFLNIPDAYSEAVLFILAGGLWAIYQGWMESSKRQATFGKLLVRAYVTDINGKRLTFSTAAIRCWPMYVSHLINGFRIIINTAFDVELDDRIFIYSWFFCGISMLYMLHTLKNQGIHDLMSGTLVMRRPKKNKAVPSLT